MIDKKEAKTYIVRLYCNKCGNEMASTGVVHTSYPIQYPYKCPNCGWKTTANERYPKIEYQEIEKDDEEDNVQ